MEKKDIQRWSDSFYEAIRITNKLGAAESLRFLNSIVENECSSSLEQSYYISVMYYVQNLPRAYSMIKISKQKNPI